MGNNEMVGPFGAATVFGWQAPPLPFVRLVTALQRLRTGQSLMELGRKLTGHGEKATTWGGMGMFMHNQVAPDSPRKETVYRSFQGNLDDIVRLGVKSGAKVLLNTVAVNLKDCPPFASMTGSHLSAADRAQLDTLYTNGMQAAAHKEFAKAAEFFERAAQLDAKSAELQFHWGECLLTQTNLAGAREHFQLACDNDALPFRADSRINAAIRAEREKFGGGDVILLDAAAALGARSGSGVCGQETFYEHVHFDFDGRYQLGLAWAGQIEPLLPHTTNAWVSQAVCNQMLGLSPWNRAQVIHLMVERMQMRPLSSQANNARRRDALESRINRLATQMNADNDLRTRKAFLKLLEQRPEDYFLHQEYAVFLELVGDLAPAVAEWQHFRDLLPHDCLGYYAGGRLLIGQQRYAEAEALLRIATAIRPSRTDGWIELGKALALQNKYPEALACYSTALKQDSQNPQTLLRRGKVLAHLDRHAEAMASYRAAIQLNPADGPSHNELGLELVAARETDSAGKEFSEAARLNPENAGVRLNYGTWLLNQSRWDEAQREFEAVVRLEPGNLQAQQNLASLHAKKGHTP
jgi:tetratricopeptide (TPR) repeat protein